MRILLVTLTITCAWGQLNRPMLGLMLDSNGAARPVFGLPGSIVVGDPAATGVLSSACSPAVCLLKTDVAIVGQGQSANAPPGPALFAFDPTGAYVYFPETRQLAHWRAGQLQPVDFEAAGEVLSIRAATGGVEFAVRRDGGIWITGSENALVEGLPLDAQIVMLLDQSFVFATREAIVLRRPDASALRFPLAHATSIAPLGASYVQIVADGSTYALRVDAGREQLFLLPEPEP